MLQHGRTILPRDPVSEAITRPDHVGSAGTAPTRAAAADFVQLVRFTILALALRLGVGLRLTLSLTFAALRTHARGLGPQARLITTQCKSYVRGRGHRALRRCLVLVLHGFFLG